MTTHAALIERLRKIQTYGNYSEYKEYGRTIDEAIAALQADAKDAWVPVSERLPQHGGRYLVWLASTDTGETIGVRNYVSSCRAWDGRVADVITAWSALQLPPPYAAIDTAAGDAG